MLAKSCRRSAKSLVSSFAMALSLSGGAVLATAAFAPAVLAQSYSRGFVEVYQPTAEIVNAEGGDVNAAASRFPALIAAVKSPDEQFAAGNLILQAGNKATNSVWMRQGLELMLASGKVEPEKIGQFNFYVGQFAFQAEDYAAARTALAAAQSAGFTDGDPALLIAESYFRSDDVQGGMNYILEQGNGGATLSEDLLLRGLQRAYDARQAGPSLVLSERLVAAYPTKENWEKSLQVIAAVNELGEKEELDLLRLMRLTDSMTRRNDYVRYIEAADPRIMSNEIVDVLAEAVAAGHLATSDTYYREIKSVVDQRMAGDRADAPASVRSAERAANGAEALGTGDLLYSLDDFAGAERMYAVALEKGGVDANVALTRLGIAQVRQNKHAEAKASFGRVTGSREPVAKMWSAYVDSHAG